VYTRAFTRALADAGARPVLYVNRINPFWDGLDGKGIEVVPLEDEDELLARLPAERTIVVTQGPVALPILQRIAEKHVLASFSHMPIQGGRGVEEFRPCRLVAAVSRYSIGLLREAGLEQVYPVAMYGVADAARGDAAAPVRRHSQYLWDHRKGRDRMLGMLEPLAAPFRSAAAFEKSPGLTLGIVSLLMPIKQFPLLFSLIAPILERHRVNLEIFGAGGYAQVRDLKRALASLGARARFWGYQQDVAAVYPKLDYLLAGLPEKEALGLNLLEAQACGTPVLAPNAPPFTETVLEGKSGYLYRDPREDAGRDFERVLQQIQAVPRPDPRQAAAHLAQFSYSAFVERTAALLRTLQNLLPKDANAP